MRKSRFSKAAVITVAAAGLAIVARCRAGFGQQFGDAAAGAGAAGYRRAGCRSRDGAADR